MNNKEKEAPQIPVPVPSTPEAVVVGAMVDIAKESMRCFTDYLKCKEHEVTERIRIKAALSAITEKINAQKEMYIKTIETNYTERKELYNKADQALKYAVEMHDLDMLKCTYNYILSVYNGSTIATLQLAGQFVDDNKMIDFFN